MFYARGFQAERIDVVSRQSIVDDAHRQQHIRDRVKAKGDLFHTRQYCLENPNFIVVLKNTVINGVAEKTNEDTN